MGIILPTDQVIFHWGCWAQPPMFRHVPRSTDAAAMFCLQAGDKVRVKRQGETFIWSSCQCSLVEGRRVGRGGNSLVHFKKRWMWRFQRGVHNSWDRVVGLEWTITLKLLKSMIYDDLVVPLFWETYHIWDHFWIHCWFWMKNPIQRNDLEVLVPPLSIPLPYVSTMALGLFFAHRFLEGTYHG